LINCRRVFEAFDDHVKHRFSVVAGISPATPKFCGDTLPPQ